MKVILSVPDEGYSERNLVFMTSVWNNLHQVCSEKPSSGMLRITFIRYAQNKLPSGMLRINFIRYAQNKLHQVCSE
jgi:hypothetical protein